MIYLLALFTAILHLTTSSLSGYFSDETYYIDCANHLSFGYFDTAPLVPFLIRISTALFGHTPFAVRFFPALGHAGAVCLTGMVARELGGKHFAQAFACLCIVVAPGFLMLGNLFLSPSLEPFFWTLACYLILLVIKHERTELWPWIGVVIGVGFLNKSVILLLAAMLVLGILASPSRKLALNRRFAVGALVAFLVILPNLIWQATHDWNTLVFLRSVKSSPLVQGVSAFSFLLAPILALNPASAAIWLGGLGYLALARETRQLRLFAWSYPAMLATLWILGGKPYYIAGAYPFLFAAGAVLTERVVRPKAAVFGAYAVLGVALLPAGLPLLSAQATEQYMSALHAMPIADALQLRGVRPDMEGTARERLLSALEAELSKLSPAERASAVILTSHYFEASWINVLGRERGLPTAVSGSTSYYEWGPGERAGEVTLAIGFPAERLQKMFSSVVVLAGDEKLALCRSPLRSLREEWPSLRAFPF